MSVKFKIRAKTTHIFIHCSATKPSMDVGVRDIRLWHKQQGWMDIGYHFVIRRDGTLENGREQSAIGSHVKGYNSTSVGVCLVGGISQKNGKPESNYTDAQWKTLGELVIKLEGEYPGAKVLGHCDVDKGKACPCFDVRAWHKGLTES